MAFNLYPVAVTSSEHCGEKSYASFHNWRWRRQGGKPRLSNKFCFMCKGQYGTKSLLSISEQWWMPFHLVRHTSAALGTTWKQHLGKQITLSFRTFIPGGWTRMCDDLMAKSCDTLNFLEVSEKGLGVWQNIKEEQIRGICYIQSM